MPELPQRPLTSQLVGEQRFVCPRLRSKISAGGSTYVCTLTCSRAYPAPACTRSPRQMSISPTSSHTSSAPSAPPHLPPHSRQGRSRGRCPVESRASPRAAHRHHRGCQRWVCCPRPPALPPPHPWGAVRAHLSAPAAVRCVRRGRRRLGWRHSHMGASGGRSNRAPSSPCRRCKKASPAHRARARRDPRALPPTPLCDPGADRGGVEGWVKGG